MAPTKNSFMMGKASHFLAILVQNALLEARTNRVFQPTAFVCEKNPLSRLAANRHIVEENR